MDLKTVKLNCLTSWGVENEPIFKKNVERSFKLCCVCVPEERQSEQKV